MSPQAPHLEIIYSQVVHFDKRIALTYREEPTAGLGRGRQLESRLPKARDMGHGTHSDLCTWREEW